MLNLFYNNMPRLSVDLDCVYVDREKPRDEALAEIDDILLHLTDRLRAEGFGVQKSVSPITKIVVSTGRELVKVEINPFFRGVLLYPEFMPFCEKVQTLFQVSGNTEIPLLNRDELYAGKILAALDRQHPRDLFDVGVLMQNGGISDLMLDCFTVYLAAHGRPAHEVLMGPDKDIDRMFENDFAGMTDWEVSLDDLKAIRSELRETIVTQLGKDRYQFLYSVLKTKPQWDLMPFELRDLPALQWKLKNLDHLHNTNPEKFEAQLDAINDIYLNYNTQHSRHHSRR